MIACANCGKHELVDTKQLLSEKESPTPGLSFPEGLAASARTFSRILVVQCSSCGHPFTCITKGVEYLLAAE